MYRPNGTVCDHCGQIIPRGSVVKPHFFLIHLDFCSQACMDAAEEKRRRAWLAKEFSVEKRGRHWKVSDGNGDLVCLAVYKKGAQEVVRRLKAA